MSGTAPERLSIRGLSHSFGGVHAVRGVDLTFRAGEICVLLGENGAGKSTLMKAVTGALRPDRGEVLLRGRPLPLGDPGAIRRLGISIIYQELSLVGPLPVHENLTLGREPRRGPFVDRARSREQAATLLARLETGIDPDAPTESLSIAEQQLVEIARALSGRAEVLIMDEPTSSLSAREADRLFRIVRSLAQEAVTVIFITHRLAEVRRLAHRAVILRDGAVVADGPQGDFSDDDLVRAMVGRTLDRQFPRRRRRPGEVVLQVENLTIPPRTAGVTFDVRAGEVVALTGLVGAGRTDVGRALFGVERIATGTVRLDGAPLPFTDPHGAAAAGVGWVSEDRKGEGLILSMSVLANLTLPHLDRFAQWGWIDRAAERHAGAEQVERLSIRTAGLDQEVAFLSGGNQQKVAIGRWLLQRCRLLVVDEPTRGVDVGGRHDIYELLEELAGRGVAVLMISSDLPEVLGMADRVVVMHEGRVNGVLSAAAATQEEILRLAMGRAA